MALLPEDPGARVAVAGSEYSRSWQSKTCTAQELGARSVRLVATSRSLSSPIPSTAGFANHSAAARSPRATMMSESPLAALSLRVVGRAVAVDWAAEQPPSRTRARQTASYRSPGPMLTQFFSQAFEALCYSRCSKRPRHGPRSPVSGPGQIVPAMSGTHSRGDPRSNGTTKDSRDEESVCQGVGGVRDHRQARVAARRGGAEYRKRACQSERCPRAGSARRDPLVRFRRGGTGL